MLESLNKYFDKFIKQYHPYEDNEFYQILIKFLQEKFLVESYEDIPKALKIIYEEHTLIPDTYDIILESIGYDKKLLTELSFNQKKIILHSFTDYQYDKGDLKSCLQICSMFNEPINLYELYIDYRVSTSLFDWYFIPKPLSLTHESLAEKIVPLQYDEIYNDTPTYFVNKATLINAYRTKSIKLPLKSNLLLLEISSLTESDELTNLTLSTALFHFRNLEIPIHIEMKAFSIPVMGLYQLWNYLLMLFYDKLESYENSQETILYDLSGDSFPYTLDESQPNNLQLIRTEYDALEELEEISEFYTDRFRSVFLGHITPQVSTLTSIKRSLSQTVDINLIQYIDTLIGDHPTADSISSILLDLRNSLIDYINNVNEDPLFEEYSSVLLNVFELALVNPLNTATYKLIDYFKPYHTQLVSKFKFGISYKSKFTNALLKQSVMFVIHHYEVSACVISIDAWFNERIVGNCQIVNGSEIIVDESIGLQFTDGTSYVYWESGGDKYPTDLACLVTSAYESGGTGSGIWSLILDDPWPGDTGSVNYCYKRYRETEM